MKRKRSVNGNVMVKFISVHSCKSGCKERFVATLLQKGIHIWDVGLEIDSFDYVSDQTELSYSEWIIQEARKMSNFENGIVIFEDLAKDGVDLDNCEGYFIELGDSPFFEFRDKEKFDTVINVYDKKLLNDKIDILIK